MAKSRQQKSKTIDQLIDLFKNRSAVVFADYQGMTVAQADVLRKEAHKSDVTYVVAKKTLLNYAAKEAGLVLDAKSMPGMLGAAFSSEDEIAPAKMLGDMAKTSSLKLVGGIYNKEFVDKAYVTTLASLPSKQQLLGMFLNVINGPTSGFVRALDAIRKQKEGATA